MSQPPCCRALSPPLLWCSSQESCDLHKQHYSRLNTLGDIKHIIITSIWLHAADVTQQRDRGYRYLKVAKNSYLLNKISRNMLNLGSESMTSTTRQKHTGTGTHPTGSGSAALLCRTPSPFLYRYRYYFNRSCPMFADLWDSSTAASSARRGWWSRMSSICRKRFPSHRII